MRISSLLLLSTLLVTAAACSESTTPVDGGDDSGTDAGTDGGTDSGTDGGTDSGTDGGMTCPPGEAYYEPGCGFEGGQAITPGCYQACDRPGTCPDGLSCQWATINPCICPPGEACCDACGSETALCVDWTPDDAPYELESLDEDCEGLTGQQLLDIAGGAHTVPFTYVDDTADTELTLTFSYTDGTITCQPSVRAPPGVGAPNMPPHVELIVAATAVTADGAFDEAADDVSLRFGGFGADEVNHNFAFDAASLGGSYVSPDPIDDVRFGGSLILDGGLRGTVFADYMIPGGATSVSPIGRWNTR